MKNIGAVAIIWHPDSLTVRTVWQKSLSQNFAKENVINVIVNFHIFLSSYGATI